MWRKLRLTILGRVIILRVWLPARGGASRATKQLEGGRAAGWLRSRCYEGKYLIHLCLVQVAFWLQCLLNKIYFIVLKLQSEFCVRLLGNRFVYKNDNTEFFMYDELCMIIGKILIHLCLIHMVKTTYESLQQRFFVAFFSFSNFWPCSSLNNIHLAITSWIVQKIKGV